MPEEKRFICQINGASEKQNNPWLLYMCQAPRIALAFQRDTQGTSCVQWTLLKNKWTLLRKHFRTRHLEDMIIFEEEGQLQRCNLCGLIRNALLIARNLLKMPATEFSSKTTGASLGSIIHCQWCNHWWWWGALLSLVMSLLMLQWMV